MASILVKSVANTSPMRYAHLSPKYLREEMTRTEIPVELTEDRAQARAHDPAEEVASLAE